MQGHGTANGRWCLWARPAVWTTWAAVAALGASGVLAQGTLGESERGESPTATGDPADAAPLSKAIRYSLAAAEATPEGQVVLLVSAEAQHLLRSAADAVERGDWKVAIDAFQRIVDQYGGELLSAEGDLYESGRRCVRRLLAELPPDGLAAYRLLNDAEAASLFARARRDHHLDALRAVVDRYFLTTIGDDAADLLAAWLIDAGRPVEALALLDDVERFYPDSDVSPGAALAKGAIALAMLGDLSAAEELARRADRSARAPVLPPGWHREAADLARAVAAAGAPAPASANDEWPALLGGGHRLGRMPETQPRLLDVREWRAWIDDQESGEDSSSIPRSYAIVAGGRLMVKTGARLIGFDPETMQRVWETAPSVASFDSSASARDRWPVIVQLPDGRFRFRGVVRSDEVSWVASAAGGLVFYIDPWGRSVVTEPDPVAANAPEGTGAETRAASFVRGNRLIAYDPDKGVIRWSRGRSTRPDDPLAQVAFRSPPVPVGDDVMALYERGTELLLGRLDPATGRLSAEKALCGVPSRAWGPGDCLMMTAADGVIFVPTERGCLFAVNAHDLSFRWVLRYGGQKGTPEPEWWDTHEREPERGWALCPPVVAGSSVLLAAEDANQLIAVDRQGGQVRWRVSRQGFRYLAGADRRTCWLVGRRTAAVDVATGDVRWSVPVGGVTGRAALSGDRLYVPTTRGVLVLSAETGDALDTLALPASQSPLGNLLCYGGALFSVDDRQVRKYPDLDSWYTRTRRRFAELGASASLAIRLAWLEILRGEPEAALAVLDAVGADTVTDIRRRLHLDHLRVRCLLELADGASEDLDRSSAYLRRAVRLAVSPTERMQTGLALAGLEVRRGQIVDAMMRYLSVAESVSGAHSDPGRNAAALIPLPDGVWRHIYDIVRERLATLKDRLSEPDEAVLRSALAARIQAATDRRDYAAMELYAEVELPFGLGQEAGIRLGRWEVEEERYEVAAGCFADAIARDAGLPQTARAVSELGKLYLRPEVYSALTAAELADRLASAYPEERARARWPASLRPEDLARQRQVREQAPFQVPTERLRRVGYGNPRRVIIAGALPEILERRLLLVTQEDRLVCERLDDGEPLWEASLRLDRRNAWQEQLDEQLEFDNRGLPLAPVLASLPAVCDGLVLIVRADDGLHAVGAATGRAIWYRPIRGGPLLPGDPPGNRIAYEAGLLAFVPRPGTLETVRAGTGRTVWRTELRPSEAASLLMVDGRLIALSEDLRRAHVFDATDGTRRGVLTFAQPPEPLDVVVLDGVVCGPQDEAVIGYELETGELLWRHRPGRAVTRLFDASAEVLGIGARKGQVEFLEARSGRVLLRVAPESVVREFHDAAISGDVVCVAGESDRGDFILVGMELKTGRRIWGPKTSRAPVELFAGWLTGSPHLAGVVSKLKQDYVLVLLDKRTGRRVGKEWRFRAPGRQGPGPSLQWFPGRMVFSNGQRWWVLATGPPPGNGGQL